MEEPIGSNRKGLKREGPKTGRTYEMSVGHDGHDEHAYSPLDPRIKKEKSWKFDGHMYL